MPRSPARDLSDRYTGHRAYFHRSELLRSGKYALTAVAVLFAGVWAAADITRPARTAYAHTHGPLANPHAIFDENCTACHAAHSPGEFGLLSMFRARDRWHDLTCEKCHGGPAHHANITQPGRDFHARCSNCHHDHLGRTNSLVRIADSHCTHCHANLAAWDTSKPSRYVEKITNFVTDHPEFRPLKEPQNRTLKFSHAVHMNRGQAYTADGKEAMTVAKLRALAGPEVERYRKPGQTDTDLVQLECASCHKLDSGIGAPDFDKLKASLDRSGEPTRSILPPRAEGAYFLGVNFESHCRACHPLKAPAEASAGKIIPGFDVPHRKQDLLADLKAGYADRLVTAGHPTLAAPPQPGDRLDRPLPGSWVDNLRASLFVRPLGAEIDRLSANASGQLLTGSSGCAKCHDTAGSGTAMKVQPVPDRTVWFTHARFNHAVHRATTCATCHPGTGAAYSLDGKVVEKEPVQIVGVDSCKSCHSPSNTRVTMPDGSKITGGGIRHNCTDCHTYHHADFPLQGRGAAARFPPRPLDLTDFLKGK